MLTRSSFAFSFVDIFWKGLIQTGAWVIFYDFNCIEPNVLSIVAQQMLTIQSAKAQNAIKIYFQETTLKLDASCGVFVTINPDYPGNIDLQRALLAVTTPTWNKT